MDAIGSLDRVFVNVKNLRLCAQLKRFTLTHLLPDFDGTDKTPWLTDTNGTAVGDKTYSRIGIW